jgi:hypothetical protein
MSGTLQASIVKDSASATSNLTLDASGNVTVGNNLTVSGTGNTSFGGNVGIGTTTPGYTLDVRATTGSISATSNTGTNYAKLQCNNSGGSYQFGIDNSAGTNFGSGTAYSRVIWNDSSTAPTILYTSSTERMRITSGGYLCVNATTANYNGIIAANFTGASQVGLCLTNTYASNSGNFVVFSNSAGGTAGYISQTGSSTISYVATSDYRLKENVAPITTGLATVSALKPVTYDWIGVDEKGEGFIAHELAEVVPHAVVGEKDAINEDGSIKPQGVDYSKIVVHLVAAIQELSAKNDALEARLSQLEAK